SSLEAYRFDEAANRLYHFIWHEYCDWYLELVKPALFDKEGAGAAGTRTMLLETFDTLLRLVHPFMPFITEEIWQAMPHTGESLMIARYPSPQSALRHERSEQEVESVQEVVSAVRDIRGVQAIPPSRKLEVVVHVADDEIAKHLQTHRLLIMTLAGLAQLTIG